MTHFVRNTRQQRIYKDFFAGTMGKCRVDTKVRLCNEIPNL
jgi:hypothetical protein